MTELTDQGLLLRLRNFEDHFVERNAHSDSKDWLKTVVAFANSVPIDYPAVLFIGVLDDGTIQDTVNLDTLQKSFSREINKAYPPVYYLPRVLSEGGKQFLAVIVPGSAARPHFSGPAFIREGSQSKQASEEQFAKLIAERQSKAYEILKWVGKTVTLEFRQVIPAGHAYTQENVGNIRDCHQFWLTYDCSGNSESVPLSRVDLSFDQKKKRLKLEIRAE